MSNEHVNSTVRSILDTICPPAGATTGVTMGEPVKPVAGPVAAVYAKYKHLDRVFSMLAERYEDPTVERNPIHAAAADLWQAIKAQEAG